jgi:hypothetical protein
MTCFAGADRHSVMGNPLLAGIQALIIEEEFLIAMDIEFIVAEAGGTSLALRSFQDALRLKPQWSNYRIALVNPPDGSISESEIAREMQNAGIRLVICTADRGSDSAKFGLNVAPMVIKPFTADDVLAACAIALGA